MLGRRGPWVLVLPLLLSTTVVAAAAPAGRASPVQGSEFRISGSGATGADFSPAIAANESFDEYLVVWDDGRTSTGAIYARRLGLDGSLVGGDRRVSGAKAQGTGLPAVAWNGTAQEYLVVWEDYRDPSRGSDIYAVRLAPDGTRRGRDRRISDAGALGFERFPAVIYHPFSDSYLVVWSDTRAGALGGSDIYGRRIGPDGRPKGTAFRVTGSHSIGDDATPDLAWSPGGSGKVLVVWGDGRKPGRGFDVFGRMLSPTGKRLGGDFRISNSGNGNGEYEPAVAWSPAVDEFLVVWEDERSSAKRGTDIYGHRVTDGAGPVGSDFRVSGKGATADDADPGVAYSRTASEFLVVWADGRDYTGRAEDVYGRRVSTVGTPIGGDFRISGTAAVGAESDPRAAFLYDAAGYVVVWADDRSPARSWDVWGRRVAG